ncbi:hypothetical protein [Kangiella aquimarina]|uniref:Uncharacterized protein n=1 Tax=Kangiella aquimarina TaxID=261965 RepID=A0ABZ0X6G3_9GAMM|nr:hypothetical protein [Kangiella aquimarina]WQG86197.1 hypothetical protein SR900_04715 [Kangiella aquimarina]
MKVTNDDYIVDQYYNLKNEISKEANMLNRSNNNNNQLNENEYITPEFKYKYSLYHDGYMRMLSDYNLSTAVTIQYSRQLSMNESDKLTSVIIDLISKKMFGNHYHRVNRNNFRGICVREKNGEGSKFPGNYHYHIGLKEKQEQYTCDLEGAMTKTINEVIYTDIYKFAHIPMKGLCTSQNLVKVQPMTNESGLHRYFLKTTETNIENFDNVHFINNGKLFFK